jgi:hypothetical protein
MAALTDRQIQQVREDLKRKGITLRGLDNDLLDHLLCGIECHLDTGQSFDDAYRLASRGLAGDESMDIIQQ